MDDAAEDARERQAGEQASARVDAGERRSASADAAGMNHHGTPFIAGSTIVVGAEQRRHRLAGSGRAPAP